MLNRILVTAAVACLSVAAQAHGDHDTAAAPAETNKIVVVRDADTGKLRAATADELAALNAQGKTAATTSRANPLLSSPMPKLHSSGARGVRMTDEMASYSVAVRRADGTIDMQCLQDKATAEAVVNGAQAQTSRVEK